MYLSLDWLKDYVSIPRALSARELALKLTMHTVEIDSVEKQADKFAGVVVGKILSVVDHPDADKLRIAEVDTKDRILKIVCGAMNIKPSQFVPVALVGTTLPNGVKIESAKIRGQISEGMLCAEDELGLGEDHSGIMILGKAKLGQNLAEYLRIDDVIFEVDNKSITNRPDLWGHYGMARDISVFLDTKLKNFDELLTKDIKINKKDSSLKVKVEDYKLCSRYMAICLDNINISKSPDWLAKRLVAVGMRPINNIVDITNYVMLELGQPLHAFARDTVDRIVVRQAQKGEEIKTLDREKRELQEKMLVIADSKKPIAIAGIMGGEETEIDENTDSIIIESANFDFVSIRHTSQQLGLRTEASMRFEKCLDPNLCEMALKRTVKLIKKIIPQARITGEIIDKSEFILDTGPIFLNMKWLKSFIGQDIKKAQVIDILERLGFKVNDTGDELSVIMPTWRAGKDISQKEDIAEEIARIYGYTNITPQMPMIKMAAPLSNKRHKWEREIKNILCGAPAMSEVQNYSFVGEDQVRKIGLEINSYLRVTNPVSKNFTMLRQNLAPNLLLNVHLNQSRYNSCGIFEIGSVYLAMEGDLSKGDNSENLPYQEKRLGLLVFDDKGDIFGRLKGIITYLLDKFDLKAKYEQIENVPAWAEKNVSAQINVNNENIGFIYSATEKSLKKIGIKKNVVIAEISLVKLWDIVDKQGLKQFKEFEKYPPLIRDLAFVVSEKVLYNDIKDEMLKHHEYIKQVDLFDEYHGGKLGKGNKNLAFHVVYQANKTLTAKEVDHIQKDLLKKLNKRFAVKIRNF